MDRQSAPIGLGIIVVAALFGLVGAAMLWVVYEWQLAGAVFGGGCVAAVAALVLWLGWGGPQTGPTGPRDLSPEASGAAAINVPRSTGSAGGSSLASASASATAAPEPEAPAPEPAPAAATETPAPEPAVVAETPAPEPAVVAETPAPEPAPAVSVPAATEETKVAVGQSTPLPGETELAERKGEWRYEGNGADQSATADAAPAEVAGTKPAALDGPRDGKADDLKQIKGVGPKLEKLCNELGFYHFDQVANWTADEVAWVDQNLEGFKGRVSRDDWVSQAKVLASGGTTEFSAKVEKGGVY